ncbi:D-alanyl-D-alanine carboxypeptidase [Candidatus Woesebacteria bacterium]|nr:D-alanyl-D-alanine carboxypeptidase [Candidatus Woesebacteria bacterium]
MKSKEKDNNKDPKNKVIVSFISSIIILLLIAILISFNIYLSKSRYHLNIYDQDIKVLAVNDEKIVEKKSFAKLPVLKKDTEFPLVSARSVMAIDLESGSSLYKKDPDVDSLPASTTKIMTAIVAMEYYDPAEEIVVEKNGIVGQKMGLIVGERITVDSLIKGLLIASANDAAEVLARHYQDGREGFIEKMNEKVIKLRLTNTFFKNPSGLDEMGQTTTARDLMKLATYSMQKPYFREIVGTKKLDVYSVDGNKVHTLNSTNELLGEVEGVLGTKTGWTENARENLVTYIERDDKKVIIVLLGSQDRFGETRKLIDWIFESYDWTDVNIDI